jgi:hypothetical protein
MNLSFNLRCIYEFHHNVRIERLYAASYNWSARSDTLSGTVWPQCRKVYFRGVAHPIFRKGRSQTVDDGTVGNIIRDFL